MRGWYTRCVRHRLVVLMTALVARAAAAVPVCTAYDIAGVDPGCPLQGTCTITRDIEVSGPCTLDFGTRAVSLDTNRKISIGGPGDHASLAIRAGSFTMLPTTSVDGPGNTLDVSAAGDVVLQQINLSGDSGGGADITAGGSVYLQGAFTAKAMSINGTGGVLAISAGGDLVTAAGSVIDLHGGNTDDTRGGRASFDTAGQVDLGDLIDVRGGGGLDGAFVRINAGSDIILRGVRGDASSSGYGSPGANVDLHADGNVRILDAISLRGASTRVHEVGGDGGSLSVMALGNLSIEAPISLDGGFPYSDPGSLTVEVDGAISVAAGGPISARTRGATESGGIQMSARSTITIAARIDTTGGCYAKSVEIEAEGDITLGAPIDARGFAIGAAAAGYDCPDGGAIDVTAHGGSLLVGAPLYTALAPISLEGCDVTVASTGLVTTSNQLAGDIYITARGQLRIDGSVTARPYRADDADAGEIVLEFPTGKPPIFGPHSVVRPAPELSSGGDLGPCPRCGNGDVEGNEECDDGNHTDCDGCESNCTVSSRCPRATPTQTAIPTPPPTLTTLVIDCAGDIEAADLGCPPQGACTITRDVEITGACTLDFGTRPVSVGEKSTIRVAPRGHLTVKAGSFTMQPGAFIDGRGHETTAPDNRGGALTVIVMGDVVLQQRGATRARIDMSAPVFPGAIAIDAGGNVDLKGPLTARRSVTRADEYGFGGFVLVKAAATVDVGDLVDVTNAGGGGTIIIAAGSDVVVRGLRGNGGGSVDISAGRNVQILEAINLLGSAPGSGQQSPFAGIVYIGAPGDLSIEAPISVDGTGAGGEGRIAIAVGGAINVAPGAPLSARGYGDLYEDENGIDEFKSLGGGSIDMRAGSTITTAARIDASGDTRGGKVGLDANGDIMVRAPVDVTGYHGHGLGGRIETWAGQGASGGALLIDQALYADGGVRPEPFAGSIDLDGCEVTVMPGALLSARAPGSSGYITISARASLRIDGLVTAKAISSGATDIVDGVIALEFPARRPPTIGARGSVRPEPSLTAQEGCDSTCRLSNTCPPATPTPPSTGTAAASATATVTPTVTLIASATASPTPAPPTPAPPPPPLIDCAGDCDANGEVTVDELTRGVGIALGARLLGACPAFDMNNNAEITIDELVQGINNALNGCPEKGGSP